jgi:hypothetical protein
MTAHSLSSRVTSRYFLSSLSPTTSSYFSSSLLSFSLFSGMMAREAWDKGMARHGRLGAQRDAVPVVPAIAVAIVPPRPPSSTCRGRAQVGGGGR